MTVRHLILSRRGGRCQNFLLSVQNQLLNHNSVITYQIYKRLCSSSSVLRQTGTYNTEQERDLALYPNPSVTNMFVPRSKPASIEDIRHLQEFVRKSKRVLVLTGV